MFFDMLFFQNFLMTIINHEKNYYLLSNEILKIKENMMYLSNEKGKKPIITTNI
jgi:hypothetical protein